MSRRHMARERELLAKRQMLKEEVRKKYDELDVIFQEILEPWKEAHKKYDELDSIVQQIKETKAKIEEQRQKQQVKEPAIFLRSDPTLVDRMRDKEKEA